MSKSKYAESMEHYVGLTPLSEIMKSDNVKYLEKMLNEAESRLCSSYVWKSIYKRICDLKAKN